MMTKNDYYDLRYDQANDDSVDNVLKDEKVVWNAESNKNDVSYDVEIFSALASDNSHFQEASEDRIYFSDL